MKRRLRANEQLESRQLMASDWQNVSLIRDVDHSGLVTPLDALVLVNAINESGIRVLPRRLSRSSSVETQCGMIRCSRFSNRGTFLPQISLFSGGNIGQISHVTAVELVSYWVAVASSLV